MMPDRIVRANILTSERLSGVSIGAELLWYKLVSLVDDYARYDGRLRIIWRQAFPCRELPQSDVEKWLHELVGADAITIYEVHGKPYLQMCRWREKPRAGKSKWPDPVENGSKRPASSLDSVSLQTNVGKCPQMQADVGNCGQIPSYSYSYSYSYSTAAASPVKLGDFQAAAAAIRKKFPATDDKLLRRIFQSGVVEQPDISDEQMVAVVTAATTKNQRTAALYLRTVPAVIKSWQTHS